MPQKDYYEILGVRNDATPAKIKAAFVRLARTSHSDKGGNDELMSKYNEAYEVLKDAEKRAEYDKAVAGSPDTIDDVLRQRKATAYLTGTKEPMSAKLRRQHKAHAEKFSKNPLRFARPREYFKEHDPQIYDITEGYDLEARKGNLFDYLRFRAEHESNPNAIAYITSKNLTQQRAVEILIDFLEGDFYGNQIAQLREYFVEQTKQAEGYEKQLYQSISKIFLYTEEKLKAQSLLHYLFSLPGIGERLAKINAEYPWLANFASTIKYASKQTLGYAKVLLTLGWTLANQHSRPVMAAVANQLPFINKWQATIGQHLASIAAQKNKIRPFLNKTIDRMERDPRLHTILRYLSDMPGYPSIQGVLTKKPRSLLGPLQELTDYMKQSASYSMPYCAQLLQNEHFRALYTTELNSYWRAGGSTGDMQGFSGYQKARDELERILDQRAGVNDNGYLEAHTIRAKLLYIFEKTLGEHLKNEGKNKLAKTHRDYAFDMLDWLQAFSGKMPRDIFINLYLQAGTQLQEASKLEKDWSIAMADETMVIELYIGAIVFSQRATADVLLYTQLQVLKRFSSFSYAVENLKEIIEEQQEACLQHADLFPLLESEQSNSNFMDKRMGLQSVMRRLLHSLVEIIKHNRHCESGEELRIDHKYVKVLYQVYEACMRGWYESEDPSLEAKLRVTLMEELLKEGGWSFDDLNTNLQQPYVMVKRDQNDWLEPSQTLSLPDVNQAFSALDAVEVNTRTGEISFVIREPSNGEPESERVITISDLQQMLQRNITGGLLSLDEANHHMKFHPFNKMRIAPANIFETDFLNTLLLTDYFLKFITVGQEVNGQYPYDMRHIDHMISHLPLRLRKIITDFHEAKDEDHNEEKAHRFWIEARPVTVHIPQENKDAEPTDIKQLLVPEIQMVVKKHLLKRGSDGSLTDDQSEPEEGWQVYMFTELPSEMRLRNLANDRPIMAFVKGESAVHLLDKDGSLEKHKLGGSFIKRLIVLAGLEADSTGFIEKTADNNLFLYYLVKHIAIDTKKPSHFSAEYIFAQEFTAHYDEFGEYLPEFARLRELSRVTVFISLLNSLKSGNLEVIEKLQAVLDDEADWKHKEQNIEDKLKAHYKQQLKNIFASQQQGNSKAEFTSRGKEWLDNIREKIGTLNYTAQSSEVRELRDKLYEENKARIIREHGVAAWDYNKNNISQQCDQEKSKIARELTDSKNEQVRKQLFDLFNKELPQQSPDEVRRMISEFLDGRVWNLANAVAEKNLLEFRNNVCDQFKHIARKTVLLALEGSDAAVDEMIAQMFATGRSGLGAEVDQELRGAGRAINDEKARIKTLLAQKRKFDEELAALGIGTEATDADEKALEDKCLFVPASINKQDDKFRIVYGGVYIKPTVKIDRTGIPMSTGVLNKTMNPENHCKVTNTQLRQVPTTSNNNRSYDFQQRARKHGYTSVVVQPRAAASAAAPPTGGGGSGNGSSGGPSGYGGAPAGGGSGSGSGGGRKPPGGDGPKLFENRFPADQIERVDTFDHRVVKTYSGKLNYIVTTGGQLILGKRSDKPGGGHLDLAHGAPVQAAGEVSLVNGKIKYIDNTSGHYLPRGISAQQAAEKAFSDLGFDVNGKYIEKEWADCSCPPINRATLFT